jgi:recombination protein RecT
MAARPLVTPIPAASAIILRDDPIEVLMMRRHAASSFVPDAWVFPGGAVEEIDRILGDGDAVNTHRYTAARETFEECGVWLGAPLRDAEAKRQALARGDVTFADLLAEGPVDLEQLVWTSRWITPKGSPKRFDAYFFLREIGRGVEATIDEREAVGLTWISPADAIERFISDDFPLVFPTLKNLEALVGFRTVAELIESRRGATVEAIEPILVDGVPRLP